MRHFDAKKTILQNGLTIITSNKDSDIFSIGIGIKVGSIYEDEENNGISHMLEHMLFKGTTKRNMDNLNDDLERLAGDIDIYTTYHHTVLTCNVMSNMAKDCIEIISDMLMNAVFPLKQFNLEKKVIIEEIKMSKDDPEDCSYLGLYKAAFPKSWYKYHIAGTIKSVKSIKNNTLKEFYRSYYVPNNTVICIVSSYCHEDVIEMVECFFRDWARKDVKKLEDRNEIVSNQKVIQHKKGIGQSHVLYGFDIQKLDKKEEIALALLNKRIGAGPNSIIFKELRDKKGYAYSVYSDIDFMDNIKMFYIYAGISEENLKNALAIIDNVILKFVNGEYKIDENGIRVIKDIFLTDTVIAMESPTHIVDYMLDGELGYKDPLEYQKILILMDSINLDDIKNVIDKVFKNPIIHVLMPK